MQIIVVLMIALFLFGDLKSLHKNILKNIEGFKRSIKDK